MITILQLYLRLHYRKTKAVNNILYRKLASDATELCASVGKNKAWLWEEAFAYVVAKETADWINEHVGMISPEARDELYAHLGLERPMLEENVPDIINLEIARELLLELNPKMSDEEISKIYSMCQGNPWNAPVLYSIIKVRDNVI